MARLSRTILLIYLVLLLCAPVVFAEEVTITTYYPSPYGSYNELQLYPHTPAVATCDATNGKGTMFYDSSTNQIKVCQGATGWLAISAASSSITFTYYCFTDVIGLGNPSCVNSGGAQGYCPAGYTQKAALGQWGACSGGVCGHFLPPGGSCGFGCGATLLAGNAYVCSQ
jgi:hypothetical protein